MARTKEKAGGDYGILWGKISRFAEIPRFVRLSDDDLKGYLQRLEEHGSRIILFLRKMSDPAPELSSQSMRDDGSLFSAGGVDPYLINIGDEWVHSHSAC